MSIMMPMLAREIEHPSPVQPILSILFPSDDNSTWRFTSSPHVVLTWKDSPWKRSSPPSPLRAFAASRMIS